MQRNLIRSNKNNFKPLNVEYPSAVETSPEKEFKKKRQTPKKRRFKLRTKTQKCD